MFAYLEGKIDPVDERSAVIDVGGVGYRVFVTSPTVRVSAGAEGPVRVHTHLAVREDAWTLYGFLDPRDLEAFRVLIGVNKIGPALALKILSEIPVDELRPGRPGRERGRADAGARDSGRSPPAGSSSRCAYRLPPPGPAPARCRPRSAVPMRPPTRRPRSSRSASLPARPPTRSRRRSASESPDTDLQVRIRAVLARLRRG